MSWTEVADSFSSALDQIEWFFSKQWSDGLPIIPTTDERIQAMLAGARKDPDSVVGNVPPLGGELRVRDVAVHAVMAGCLPSYMPVLLATVECLLNPGFNLLGVQATTHNCAPLLIVGGPVTQHLGMNSGHNVFGPGNRANATIGRAIRLILLNVGGGINETGDKSTFGHPGKYSFCIAESLNVQPWLALHQQLGTDTENGVSVFACEAPHSVFAIGSAVDILESLSDSIATLGSNCSVLGAQVLIAFGREHQKILQSEGWSVEDIQCYVYERARIRMADIRHTERFDNRSVWPKWVISCYQRDPNYCFPVMRYPGNIHITCLGGDGPFSVVLPGWGYMGGRILSAPVTLEQ